MTTSTLSTQALTVINSYEDLPIAGKTINCPYFNNRTTNLRGALRVLVGKGTPQEIIDEAYIISLRDKIDLHALDEKTLVKFLTDHHIGVDCAAFVYYILDAELKATKRKNLKSLLSFKSKNLLRRFIILFRTVENTSVAVLNENSKKINLKDIAPGDLIIAIGGGIKHDYNHVLIITSVTLSENGKPQSIEYTHSYTWKSEGKYTKGIRKGMIEITKSDGAILEQKWIENEKTGEENETWLYLKGATSVQPSRLKI